MPNLVMVFYQGPVTGGLTLVSNGQICANIVGAAGQMRIDAGNVDDNNNPALVRFEIDWNDGTTQTLVQGAGVGFIQNTGAHTYTALVNHNYPAAVQMLNVSTFQQLLLG
jgi:hypothetical protein